MQVLFKTRYEDDIHFLAKTGEKIRVGLVVLLLIAAPLFLQNYYLAELGLMLVYAIAGIGLMILTGHTGQVSFGHAAFLAIGAYCHSILISHGVPFSVSVVLTVTLSGVIGMLLGRSASKMHGFYLAIATLAFLILVETFLGEWEAVTGGHAGFKVPALKLFGIPLKAMWQQYYLDLFFVFVVVLGAANLFRTPNYRTGGRSPGTPSELFVAGSIWRAGIAQADAHDRRWWSGQYSGCDIRRDSDLVVAYRD
jgi:branched-chain amino acid transport system permease protein